MKMHIYDTLAFSFLLLVSTAAAAQDGAEEAAKETPKLIEIASEPIAVDPTTLLDEAVTKRVTVRFEETSISDVASWFKENTGLTVILDRKSLQNEGILTSEPVTDQLNDEPIFLLLDRLEAMGIRWHLSGKLLHLSGAEPHIYTRHYNVGDLFDSGHDGSYLLDAIVASTLPQSWEEQGGAASMVQLGDVLFVRQSNHGHREVEGLLSALRKHSRMTLITDPPQHQEIRGSLSKPISVTLRNEAFKSVIAKIAEQAGVDIRLDIRSLKKEGFRERQPIDLEVEQQTLSTTLDILARQYDLSWYLRSGVLWLTTPEQVEEFGKTAVFDVRDLCRDNGESWALEEAIISQTDQIYWVNNGGSGVIAFPLPGTMVIRQTEKTLNGVLELLENYRQALRVSKPRGNPEDAKREVVTQFYRIPTIIADDLSGVFRQLIREDTWRSEERPDAPGEVLHVLSSAPERSKTEKTQPNFTPYSVIVIRQTREVHDEIPAFLDRIMHGDPTTSGAMSGGGGMGGGGGGFGGGFFSLPADAGSR